MQNAKLRLKTSLVFGTEACDCLNVRHTTTTKKEQERDSVTVEPGIEPLRKNRRRFLVSEFSSARIDKHKKEQEHFCAPVLFYGEPMPS